MKDKILDHKKLIGVILIGIILIITIIYVIFFYNPILTEDKIITDDYGNKVLVPAGFRIIEGENVTDGIVIEDEVGNQFVWVPVGEIFYIDNNSNEVLSTDIELSRYVFDQTGIATAIAVDEEIIVNIPSESVTAWELETDSLLEFIEKANQNGGYYIARYETSLNDEQNIEVQANKEPLIDISSSLMDELIENMYKETELVTAETQLINSLAWDTAILFIQTFSDDEQYSTRIGKLYSEDNYLTGGNNDEMLNINNLASGVFENTTEYAEFRSLFLSGYKTIETTISRGGANGWETHYVGIRGYDFENGVSNTNDGFRIILLVG